MTSNAKHVVSNEYPYKIGTGNITKYATSMVKRHRQSPTTNTHTKYEQEI